MRRLFIIRKDLHLSAGKLAAMVGHCAEAYWTNLIRNANIEKFDVKNYQFNIQIPFEIYETYINDNHEEPIPVRNQKQYDLKNPGTLLRSSIIKNNNRSMIKKSGLPTVNRSYIPKANKVIMSKDFNNDGGELKASINVGLGGRKTGSRIVQ